MFSLSVQFLMASTGIIINMVEARSKVCVHFTPKSFHPISFHPTFISPHVHFTPHSFHPTFISPHNHFTPRSFHLIFTSHHIVITQKRLALINQLAIKLSCILSLSQLWFDCQFLSSANVHFTPHSFHPSFISPHNHFTPRSFHLIFTSHHIVITQKRLALINQLAIKLSCILSLSQLWFDCQFLTCRIFCRRNTE